MTPGGKGKKASAAQPAPNEVQGANGRLARILAALEANADVLARSGGLARKRVHGKDVWSVRFRTYDGGRQTYRSVYVGTDPEMLEIIRDFLKLIRMPNRLSYELTVAARLAELARQVATQWPGSRCRCRTGQVKRR